jgi:hypothetical protein
MARFGIVCPRMKLGLGESWVLVGQTVRWLVVVGCVGDVER